MNLQYFFPDVFENVVLKFWSQKEKVALLKIIYEIYHSDNAFTIDEANDFNERLEKLDVAINQIKQMNLHEAVAILQDDKLKEELVYIVLAQAIFKDEDFDDFEQEFINRFVEKYNISEEKLNHHIKRIRDKKLDKILSDWINEIEHKQL